MYVCMYVCTTYNSSTHITHHTTKLLAKGRTTAHAHCAGSTGSARNSIRILLFRMHRTWLCMKRGRICILQASKILVGKLGCGDAESVPAKGASAAKGSSAGAGSRE